MSKKLPLTGLVVGEVPRLALVCGDPQRAKQIADRLTDVTLLTQQREYHAYCGTYQGIPVAVCSHGIGAPGAAIAFEELIAAGADYVIRVGTCGSLQTFIHTGHLVIATAAVQHTGYGLETAPAGYPAVADLDVTVALRAAAARAHCPSYTGIVISRDNFYAGIQTHYTPHYQTLSVANVLAVEMECAALFLVGNLRRIRTGAVLAVDGNVLGEGESMNTYDPRSQVLSAAVEAGIEVALTAVATLHAQFPL